jgi:hypothetical protein
MGYKLRGWVTGYGLRVVGYGLRVTSYGLRVVGYGNLHIRVKIKLDLPGYCRFDIYYLY